MNIVNGCYNDEDGVGDNETDLKIQQKFIHSIYKRRCFHYRSIIMVVHFPRRTYEGKRDIEIWEKAERQECERVSEWTTSERMNERTIEWAARERTCKISCSRTGSFGALFRDSSRPAWTRPADEDKPPATSFWWSLISCHCLLQFIWSFRALNLWSWTYTPMLKFERTAL